MYGRALAEDRRKIHAGTKQYASGKLTACYYPTVVIAIAQATAVIRDW